MSEWIRIKVKDFYKDAIGEKEYTYVTKEVYEVLTETFRKEAHVQEMGCASLLRTHGTLRRSAFCREKPDKSKVSAIFEEKWMCVSVSAE